MDNAIKPPASGAEMQAILNDIAALRSDIATLASRMSASTIDATADATRNVVDQVSGEASRVYGCVAAQAERSAKAIGRQIEEQPVISLLVVFALGFLGSHLMSRPTK